MRLPSGKTIADKLLSTKTKTSIDYLMQKRSVISKYKDTEDFVLREEEYTTKTNEDKKTLAACEHHLFEVRSRFANELWSRELFLGISVIDDLLFSAFAHTNEANPIQHALEIIRDSGVLEPGFVVYPLHSLGVLGAGLLRRSTRLQFHVPDYGLVVTPQTNSFKRTVSFLENAAGTLGVRKEIPRDLIEHWTRSRPTKWLERNPLLVLRTNSFPGGYYENQFFLIYKLKIATTLLLMLNAFQDFESSKEGLLFDSSRTNNWETLDIHHYILFYPKPNSERLSGDCIPMNSKSATLAELSAVPATLDPKFWKRRIPWSSELTRALDHVGQSYLKYSIGKPKNNPKSRAYRKFFRSLEFYRKSYRTTDDEGDAAVYLTTAFEILLTDTYGRGIAQKIHERASILLKGIKGNRKLKKAVGELYVARSKYVHAGEASDGVDLKTARVAFVHSFMSLSSKLGQLSFKSEEPMKRLIENT
jgi:hypothetical protein